jgi:hypothetical protein
MMMWLLFAGIDRGFRRWMRKTTMWLSLSARIDQEPRRLRRRKKSEMM